MKKIKIGMEVKAKRYDKLFARLVVLTMFVVGLSMSTTAQKYSDDRPTATLRLDAWDQGIVLRYGDGPDKCDMLGARDIWVFEVDGIYYMHYDASGPRGWLSSLAISKDLVIWEKKGPILNFGQPGEGDSKGACYGVTYHDGKQWHMFYLGTPNVSQPPNLIPSFPYLTMKAKGKSPAGPWIKQEKVVPFRPKPGTYYSATASPGQVIKYGDEFLQFFSASTNQGKTLRTLGIARTKNLDGVWAVDPEPIVPLEEQIENSTFYYEESIKTWFLFTNHIGIDDGHEFTDAIWVYWSKNLNHWDPVNKAIVLDGQNCSWSKKCIGLPSVVQVGNRLAIFYDAPGGSSTSHMKRHVGLAWLDLPLNAPERNMEKKAEFDESESENIRPAGLQCEYLVNPLGIDTFKPRLSWRLESNKRGHKQTAYRLLVASSQEKLAIDDGDLWDSGKVESDQSRHVVYNGKPVRSRMECFWKVMTWDKDGTPSAWSEPAYWSMGLLEKEDWTAQWIGSPDSVTAPFYRHSFNLDDVPKRAPIYLAALGYFELYINGKKVGNEVLAPAVSNFNERTYYQTYDVASYLKKGKNSIGIWMGTGWYSPGLPGIKHHSPVVRAQLEISNETNQLVLTDKSWETKASARSLIGEWRWGKFGGELLDARLIDKQWWNAESSINGWKPIAIVEAADVPCTAQKCRNNIQLDEIAPVSIEQLDDTTVLFDFGTNLTGMLKMKFRNLDSGQKITIHYADLDGRAPEEAWRLRMGHKGFATYNQRDEFISAGEEEEQFNNVFNYHGYRYALIEGLRYIPKKEDLVAIPVETEVPETGSFTCSNDLYNRIHKMVRWTYRALNLGGQTVDCPHRERVGYGDGQTAMDVGCYNFDASTLYTKWSQNWWDEQKEDGFVPFVAPTPHGTGGGPAWGAMSIVVPWKTYLFYRDTKLLEAGYPYMKLYIEYLGAHSKDGVLHDIFPGEKWDNLGDWVPPRRGMDKSEWVDDNSRRFFNNCYRTHLLQIMMKVGKLLGKNDDVSVFKQELNIARKAVHEKWFNPEDTTYANGEQPYLIFPLQTGITPDELKNAVFEKYVQTMLVKDKGHLNTGMIGTQITFDYLLENNRNDLIDIMVNKKTYPGWGYMVEKGATTCWEQWNGYYSQIHSCFPYIGGWFYRGLGGIQWDPENPGFKNIILRPALVKSVDWVKCNYESQYGNIISNWRVEADQFKWDVTIPANSTATVYVQGNNITESGSPVEDAVGVTFIKNEDEASVYEVESGSYSFGSTLY